MRGCDHEDVQRSRGSGLRSCWQPVYSQACDFGMHAANSTPVVVACDESGCTAAPTTQQPATNPEPTTPTVADAIDEESPPPAPTTLALQRGNSDLPTTGFPIGERHLRQGQLATLRVMCVVPPSRRASRRQGLCVYPAVKRVTITERAGCPCRGRWWGSGPAISRISVSVNAIGRHRDQRRAAAAPAGCCPK